ncbi:MAG TPA: methionyl-tRNA formyltransferase [Solirubrobacteraceae bacterium]|nr:methionyl-tRNA formyltransferase [Solirubrobacteraceae bacterium]
MRTVYLGTSPFAAAVLHRLAESPHRPGLVVTRPDAPKGRGRRLSPPPVADTARELGIDVFQPANVNEGESVERIAAAEPEAVLLCAFGALIREPLLSRFGSIRNVHPSLLPRWRGAAPVERAIIAGDGETGVTIMAVGEGLDDGPVYVAAREPIHSDDTYGTLSERLERLSADLLIRALDEQPEPVPQPDDGVTYAEKITAADRTLDPERPAAELERVVRALTPHIGARGALPGGELLGVRRAAVAREERGPAPGELRREGDRLLLGTADGALALLEVQPPGGRPMDAAAYLRGRGA